LDRTPRARGRGAKAAKRSSPENHDEEDTDHETDDETDDETHDETNDETDDEMDDETDDEMDGEEDDSVPASWAEPFKLDVPRYMVAALRVLLPFPLDTIKTRLQAANSEQLLTSGKLFHGLYDGLGPEVARAAIVFALDDSGLTTQLRTQLRIPVQWKIHEIIKFAIGVPFEVTEAPVHKSHERSSKSNSKQLTVLRPLIPICVSLI
jgi:hypothetical protein